MISAHTYRPEGLGLILNESFNEPLHPLHAQPLGCVGCHRSPLGWITAERPNPGLGMVMVDNNPMLGAVDRPIKIGLLVGAALGVAAGIFLWKRR